MMYVMGIEKVEKEMEEVKNRSDGEEEEVVGGCKIKIIRVVSIVILF
jgi:hypothetical protein